MNQKLLHRLAACGIILLITVTVIISAFSGGVTSKTSRSISVKKAFSLYDQATEKLQSQKNISMTVKQTKNTAIAGDVFSEESKQEIVYTDLGTEEMCGSVVQRLTIGSHAVSIQEVYAKNTGYFTVQGASFRGSITQEAYLARYLPSTPITATLYDTVSAVKTGDTTVITFTDAKAPESWLTEEYDAFHTADGTAYIDDEGHLIRSDYNVSYSVNGVQIHIHSIIEINNNTNTRIKIPKNTKSYTKIQYLDAPRALEVACGYLMGADTVTANYKSEIGYQAYGDNRTEKITLNIHNGDTWAARMDTDIVLTNTSLGEPVSKISQTETFVDGKYSVSLNNTPGETELDEATMKTLCRDQLVGTILLPEYIKSAQIAETEDGYRIQFAATEVFAELIRSDICLRLYQQADQISQKYKTKDLSCYLDLDKNTNLPIGAGISYSGTYKKDGISYSMTSKTHQTYDLTSATAHSAIYKTEG